MKAKLRILCLVLCLVLLPVIPAPRAQADTLYLIPDSNTRRLTEEEIWKWDRESLAYLWNEIFARHGYVFISGGKFDLWFSAMPWYTANKNADNQKYCYPKVSQLEWDDVNLIKKVARDMDAVKEKQHVKGRKCYTQFTPPGNWKLTGFTLLENMKAGQKLAVYAAPGTSSWRGANGKALVNTNGAVWAAGWENGWLLVFYETNNGSVRVGYVQGSKISGKVSVSRQLDFEEITVKTASNCAMTDDPVRAGITIRTIPKGTRVIYLTTVVNQDGEVWDYIQANVSQKKARGFVRHGSLDMNYGDYSEESY